MGLVHTDEMVDAKGILDNGKVCGYIPWKISHIITGIEAVIRGLARAPLSGKSPVDKLRIMGKTGVPEKWG